MEYILFLAIFFAIYTILALSLNLLVGYTGLISVAHAAFFGIGAYTVAILTTQVHLSFFAAMGVAVLSALFASWLVSAIFSRLGGDYYVLGTLGFNYIAWSVAVNWEGLTHGPLGIAGIPRPELLGFRFGSNLSFVILAGILLCLVYYICRHLLASSFGRVLKAIREDEMAARVFGYHTFSYKVAVSMIAGGLAAVAGGLYASYVAYIDPSVLLVAESIFILSLVIVGGLANLKGSILGALILILLPELLRFLGLPTDVAAQLRQAIYGLALILLMLYRPQGLVGEYKY